MTEPVVIRVPAETKAAWKAAAAKAGLSLPEYVRTAVEAMEAAGGAKSATARRAETRTASTARTASVRPEDCTKRVRAGSYCRVCDSIHTKGI